jgi:predicted ester cyclase
MTTASEDIQVQHKEIISRLFEDIWNQGRLDLISTYCSTEWSNFGVQRDLGHLKQIVEAWKTAFPDLHFTVDEQIAEGDQVFSHCTLSGTYLGPFELLGLKDFLPTGKHFTVRQMHLFRLRDGKIVEHWAVLDTLGMCRQLGMVLSPGQAT